jgi:hypothetical protein
MYATTSMGECAYLLSKGYKIQAIADNPGHKTYLFDKSAAEVAKGYYADDPVPAKSFHLAPQTARKLVLSAAV